MTKFVIMNNQNQVFCGKKYLGRVPFDTWVHKLDPRANRALLFSSQQKAKKVAVKLKGWHATVVDFSDL